MNFIRTGLLYLSLIAIGTTVGNDRRLTVLPRRDKGSLTHLLIAAYGIYELSQLISTPAAALQAGSLEPVRQGMSTTLTYRAWTYGSALVSRVLQALRPAPKSTKRVSFSDLVMVREFMPDDVLHPVLDTNTHALTGQGNAAI